MALADYCPALLADQARPASRVSAFDGLLRFRAFHVAGTQFTTAFSNGAHLLQPGNPATRPAAPPRPST
ncbi:MAG: hypothetical protein ACRDP7_11700 [Trebonia sp.]